MTRIVRMGTELESLWIVGCDCGMTRRTLRRGDAGLFEASEIAQAHAVTHPVQPRPAVATVPTAPSGWAMAHPQRQRVAA